MQGQNLLSGFNEPVLEAQSSYRRLLEAMAHPGRIVTLNSSAETPRPLSPAATAIALSLFDFETRVWLAPEAWPARDYLGFHCHCPITESPAKATFALLPAGSSRPDLADFNLGTDEHPERSTTLILEVAELSNESGVTLSGPGINGSTWLSVSGVDDGFWQQVRHNHGLFPRGVDLILSCGDRLAAIPRSTKVED
ncbi:MAG: phosphonate C-P lyase system protein PhnH [Gammaproteobacteria bacterium]